MSILYKNIDLKQINVFMTVYRIGNISSSAHHLAISQSSITQQIKSLERNANCTLFERGANGVTPTEEGHLFYHRLKNEYENFTHAIHQIENFTTLKSNTIKLAAHYPYILYRLPFILEGINHLPIKIYNIARHEAEERMAAGEIDISIYPFSHRDARFEYSLLEAYKPVLIMHPDNPLSTKAEIAKDDLKQQNFLTIDQNLITLEGFCDIYNSLSMSSSIVFENGNWDMLISFVRKNIGIALISEVSLVQKEYSDLTYKDMSHIFKEMHYQIALTDSLKMQNKNIASFIKRISPDFHADLQRKISAAE